jgi:hypothetical protein
MLAGQLPRLFMNGLSVIDHFLQTLLHLPAGNPAFRPFAFDNDPKSTILPLSPASSLITRAGTGFVRV